MTAVPIPDDYISLSNLQKWLQKNLPHEYHIDGGARWAIGQHSYQRSRDWYIEFARAQDATYFTLKWPH